MGMDALVRKRKGQPDVPQTWMAAGTGMTVVRVVRAVEGNRVTLDVPLTDAIDGRLLGDEPAVVVRTPAARHLGRCGVESLQVASAPHAGDLKAGRNVAVALKGGCEDCWVRDVVMRETLNNVQVLGGRRITLTGLHSHHGSTAG